MARDLALPLLLAKHREQRERHDEQQRCREDRARQHRVLADATRDANRDRQTPDVHGLAVGDALQVAREFFAVLVAITGLAAQQLLEHCVEVARSLRQHVAQTSRSAVEHLMQHVLRRLAGERQFSSDSLEDRHAE